MVQCEYLKLFIANCKNDLKFSSNRSISFCNKTMVSFFYMLTDRIELDDQVFFTSVELLNKYLISSIIRFCHSMKKDPKIFANQFELIKEKVLEEKYLLATSCFQLATQICNDSIDSIRLIEYFDELVRIDSKMKHLTTKFHRENLIEMQLKILSTIDYRFPQTTPHLFISYFLRFLNEEIQLIISERLYQFSMLLLVQIYLQWTSIIELLAKKENGSSTVNQMQMENVTQRLRDPLLLGSSTILAASKMFCHGTNSHIHDKLVSLFVALLGIDPMRIYMAQFFADELLQKSFNNRFFIGQTTDSSISRILIEREHDFDDESIRTFSSP